MHQLTGHCLPVPGLQVLFLRLLYKPEDISAANLGRLGQRLPAVAQLASKYGVKRVLEAAEEWLLAPAPAKTPSQASTWHYLVLLSMQT